MKTILFGIISASLILTACTKEINMDLNNADPKIVIQSELSTDSTETQTLVSLTKNFSDTTTFNGVNDALVTITDLYTNHKDTLKPTTSSIYKSGLYRKAGFAGIEGHEYLLDVNYHSIIYSARATILPKIVQDSLITISMNTANAPAGASQDSTQNIIIKPFYKLANTSQPTYFQFVVTRNDTLLKSINIRNSTDYQQFSPVVPIRMRVNLAKLHSIKVSLQHIDKATFDYMFGLLQNVQQFTASPANPQSNLTNGALGHFKAFSSSSKTLIFSSKP